ncbi:response regulator [Microlunatus sp. Gsoil 973]|uniref:hybrid sensor histidine kinase/response regulator n=1 Tax=Microlunatus sp. Gsoil 973 TaxID=2672569 RepID=UPI0012B46A85|nr:response regulator [Microlunatus sp. Gsoil 973]QGN34372.1 response regulator [Microlunatus sp. Gsoil 973]
MAGLGAERLHQLFAQEADVRLAALDALLLRLETDSDPELVRSIFREVHTLKGSSAVAGLDRVSGVAHRLEELVEEVREQRQPVTSDLIDTLLLGVDELREAISAAGVTDGQDVSEAPHVAVPAVPRPADPPSDPAAGPPLPAPRPSAASHTNGLRTGAGAILVPVERLEELTRLVGQTTSAHLRVGQLLKEQFGIDPATCNEFNELSRSLNDLHDRAMRTQMVPVTTVTDQLHRSVRDLARAQGKRIRWEVAGTDTELDRGVLNRLADSLLHLIRNAVDHGVESAEQREREGKPAEATIRLHAMQLGGDVVIAVSDDGRGIDTTRIRRDAHRLGIDTEGLAEQDLVDLSFQPGLSTAQFVTDVSGRGVGLDVVRSNVEAAHGRVEVRSEAGVGTEFRIIVPITVAVLRCLLVEVGDETFALPFHRVQSTRSGSGSQARAEGRPIVWADHHPVPVTPLCDALGLAGDPAEGPVVVLGDATRRHAFVVDRLVGQRDVVVKTLSPLVPQLPAVAGASCEADGSIMIVLDPPGLIERAQDVSRTVGSAASAAAPAPRRSVLVVDDALIVRELQRGILERANFDVRVAADGQQALGLLAEEPSDLVVTDIEMPRMDGFALTRAIRDHPTLTNIPVLIVSSRASDADRARGLDAGADGYITKSNFDDASLLTAVHRLLGTTG